MTRMREIFRRGLGMETTVMKKGFLAHLLVEYQFSMLIIVELRMFIGMLLFYGKGGRVA